MKIDPPVHVSVKERDLNNVFQRIVNAAEHPHLNVPETEVGRNKKLYRDLVNRSLMLVSGLFSLLNLIIEAKLLVIR